MPNPDASFGPESDDEAHNNDEPLWSGRPGYYEQLARNTYGWPSANLPDHIAADLAEELYDVPDPRLVNDD